MNKSKKYLWYFWPAVSAGLLAPLAAMAGTLEVIGQIPVGSFSSMTALVVGVFVSLLIFINARKIGGGALAKVYNYFGIGMIFNLAGFLLNAFPSQTGLLTELMVPNILVIVGYTAMAVGAKKILDAAGLK